MQLRFPMMPGAANAVSLVEGQRNFDHYGACQKRFVDAVRAPRAADRREDAWRRLDPLRDNPESPARGINYADSYPEHDPTVLYYWRDTYWRRLVS